MARSPGELAQRSRREALSVIAIAQATRKVRPYMCSTVRTCRKNNRGGDDGGAGHNGGGGGGEGGEGGAACTTPVVQLWCSMRAVVCCWSTAMQRENTATRREEDGRCGHCPHRVVAVLEKVGTRYAIAIL